MPLQRGYWRIFHGEGRFGAVVLPSGRKTFVVQCKRNSRSQKVKIGLFGPMSAEEARTQALNLLGAIEADADPVAERRAARAVRTFREVAEDFMAQHVLAKRKPRTAESYRCLLDKYVLPELGKKRIVDIGRADVAELHSSLGESQRQERYLSRKEMAQPCDALRRAETQRSVGHSRTSERALR